MVLFEVPSMAKKKAGEPAKEAAPEQSKKRHTYEQRKDDFGNVSAYRDVAEWIVDITTEETRRAKRIGRLKGKKKISGARLIDGLLRPWAWQHLWRLRHPDRPASECPPPPQPPEEPWGL
jgi:hypothetical protein